MTECERKRWNRSAIGRLWHAVTLLGAFGLLVAIGCTATVGGRAAAGDDDTAIPGGKSTDVDSPDDYGPVADGGKWYQPSTGVTWQWQLQPGANGSIDTSYAADVYDIDLFDTEADVIRDLQNAGRRVICYFSAGTYEDFREDADAFDAADLGEVLEDFDDERWLEIRSTGVRQIMVDRLDQAAAKGCDAVEPDNVTGYLNDTGFDLTAADQLDFNRFLADAAHSRGLGIGLKNDLEQIDELVDEFDFAVNEQCHEFDECDMYDPFLEAGKPVLNAEYASRYVNDPDARQTICETARNMGLHTLVLPVDLDDAFRFSCE